VTLARELGRLDQAARHMLAQSQAWSEVPLRIHDRGADQGHGLGSPPFSAAFERYLRAAGACFCEPIEGGPAHRYPCTIGSEPIRFVASKRKAHPQRLKRALRQLRGIDPHSFDITFLIAARGMTFDQASARINAGRYAAGQEPFSRTDFVVFAINGFALLTEAY
jgi:hypothetical protein